MKKAVNKKSVHTKRWAYVAIIATSLPALSFIVAGLTLSTEEEHLSLIGWTSWYIFLAATVSLLISIVAVFGMKRHRVVPIVCVAVNLIVVYYSLYTYGLVFRYALG